MTDVARREEDEDAHERQEDETESQLETVLLDRNRREKTDQGLSLNGFSNEFIVKVKDPQADRRDDDSAEKIE